MHVARISLGLPILYFSGYRLYGAFLLGRLVIIIGNNAEHD